ncbi:MAG TPA: VCBS repeat-containing protein [Chloroflexota bacterium]|nr:VCBS repeat-containing protein [Chloroflexota bacterium]
MQRNVETASQAPKATNSKDDGEDDALDGDPKALAIKLIVEAWTGKRIKFVSLEGVGKATANAEAASEIQQATQQQQQRVGWGVEYELHETHHEYEQTRFAAEGVVKTADGKEIRFNYELEMEREFYSETHLRVRAGDALLKDPLVINVGGTAAQLTDKKFAFDIDADGTKDQVSWVQPGSGFLALDKNGNGTIDDGSELFGAQTGNGFAELAAYDDKNGWIDEADAVYGKLQVWSKSGTTDRLASLKERNVGAIGLGQLATPFELKDANNQLQGVVRSSGIYVKEDGSGVGSVQQIDLAV